MVGLTILVNDFNFKITHSDKDDVTKLKQIINNKNNNEFLHHLLNDISVNLYVTQCSNFKDFPKNIT